MKITVNKQSAIPYYHQVKEAVKTLIASGELKPGDMLPSEFSLSEQLDISRLVVHRAFRELVTEGLLVFSYQTQSSHEKFKHLNFIHKNCRFST